MSTSPQPDSGETDQHLIDAINAGDRPAFDRLYHRYRDWAYRLAMRFCGDHHLALDVLQETFVYVAGKFPGFRLTSRFTTFLYPVVRHLSIAQRRKTSRMNPQAALPETVAENRDAFEPALEDLNQVLEALPKTHREVLILRFVDGLDLAEIAEAMQIPLGTVKSRLHNSLKTLRKDDRVKKYFDR
ncbi:MAG: sigma-70 family RNA polymerase sigma factor [Phycisphaeraceae bacterium]|nr:sigma-70 family RNA polymerase sigma factor [Phycisphaeraceae bacterium]